MSYFHLIERRDDIGEVIRKRCEVDDKAKVALDDPGVADAGGAVR